jgi:hypothetical protein
MNADKSPGMFPGFFILRGTMRLWTFLLMMAVPANLFAWGSVGHKAVAYIAQDRLTPAAQAAVSEILGSGQDLASSCVWADIIAHVRKETGPWHYIQLEVRQIQHRYDLADVCRDHNCVVDQIQKDIDILKQRYASRHDKREALKFLIHFMGDLHQPLHCAEDGDRGGNEKWFRYYGSSGSSRRYQWVNLHSFWDHLLGTKDPEDPRKLASRLGREIKAEQERDWAKGNATDWAYESFKIAKEDIYSELPVGPLERGRWGKDLPRDYYSDKMRRIVDLQLEKAGVRLAWVLNEIFKNG